MFPTRSHSLRDHHARRLVTVDPITAPAGRICGLSTSQLSRVCTQANGYGVYGAVAFTVKGEPGVWLAINDKRSGFQANSDPIVQLNDFIPSLRQPITLV